MQTFTCACGARLFIDNTGCTNCGRAAGWCDTCEQVRGLDAAPDGALSCGSCHTAVRLCANYTEHAVCNRTLLAESDDALCSLCGMNETVPNLEVAGNRDRWARLEAAKRRLVHTLDRLTLPYGATTTPPLRFSFMGDGALAGLWRTAGDDERVFTGHDDGLVTINIREADDAEREALRVDMHEAHRTLIGHFRHEVGHYYWDVLIKDRPEAEAAFAALFGDPRDPDYGTALNRHYSEGPPSDWHGRYVSAYATMHPWEDWAETFALYLAMTGVLDTAEAFGLPVPELGDIDEMVRRYGELGLILNEFTREMGLLDYAPVVITDTIAQKLAHVARVIQSGAMAQAA